MVLGGKALLGVAVVLPLVAFAPSYETPQEFKWSLLALVLACLSLAGGASAWRARRLRVDGLDALGLAFIAWAALSLAYSADALAGMDALAQFALGFAVFVLAKAYGPVLAGTLAGSVSVALAAVVVLAFAGGGEWGGFWNENFLSEFLLVALPFTVFAAALASGWVVCLPLAAAVAALVHLFRFNPSKIEYFVLLCGGLAWVLYEGWRRAPRVSVLLGVATFAAGGWAVLKLPVAAGVRESLGMRVPLWLDSLLLWADRPWLGHGAGGYAALLPLYKERHLAFLGDVASNWVTPYNLTLAAHNDYLQFLAEYGVVGMIFPATAAWLLWRGVRRAGGLGAVGRLGGAAVFVGLAIALIEFPLRNPATAMLFALGLGLLAGEVSAGLPSTTLRLENVAPKVFAVLVTVGLSASAVAYAWCYDAAWRAFGRANILHNLNRPDASFRETLAACELWPGATRFRADVYLMLMNWNRRIGRPPLSPSETDQVFAIGLSSGFHHSVLVERLQYLLDTGRYRELPEETERWLDLTTKHFSRDTGVWIAQSYYRYLTGRQAQARESLGRARAVLAEGDLRLPSLAEDQKSALLAERGQQTALLDRLEAMIVAAEGASSR